MMMMMMMMIETVPEGTRRLRLKMAQIATY